MNRELIFYVVLLSLLCFFCLVAIVYYLSNYFKKKTKEEIEKNSLFFKEISFLNEKYKEFSSPRLNKYSYKSKPIDDIVYIVRVNGHRPTSRTYNDAIKDLFTNRRSEFLNKFEAKERLLELYKQYEREFSELVLCAKKSPYKYFSTTSHSDGYENMRRLNLNFESLKMAEPDFSFYLIIKTDYMYKQNSNNKGKVFGEAEIRLLLNKYCFTNIKSEKKTIYTKPENISENRPFINTSSVNNRLTTNDDELSIKKSKENLNKVSRFNNQFGDLKKPTLNDKDEINNFKNTLQNKFDQTLEFDYIYHTFMKYGLDNLFNSCKLFKGFETNEKFDFTLPFLEFSSSDFSKDKFLLLFSLITYYGNFSPEITNKVLNNYGINYSDFHHLSYNKGDLDSLINIDERYSSITCVGQPENIKYHVNEITKIKKIIDNVIEYITDYYPVNRLGQNELVKIKTKYYKLDNLLVSDDCLYYLDLSNGALSNKVKLKAIFLYFLSRKIKSLKLPKNIIILRPFYNQIITYSGKIVESSFFSRLEELL